MRMKGISLLAVAVVAGACGGGTTQAPAPEAPVASATAPDPAPAAPAPAASVSSEPPPAETSAPAPPPKIEFPAHANVEAAIKAVPQGAPRLNMSNDALQEPLLDLKRYEKCKVPRSTKVFLNVAVYDGAAVGVDVTTRPKSAKLEECLDGVVRSMTWDKVPSLNQVNANF